MPRLNPATCRLRTLQHARQVRLFAAADAASLDADRAVAGLWRELLAVLRHRHGFAHDYRRALVVLRRVGGVSAQVIQRRLAALYLSAHAGAAGTVLRAIPQAALRRARGLREGRTPGFVSLALPAPAFVRHEISGRGEVLVMVDPARLDAAWARGHPDYYLPAQGPGKSEVKGRREGFKDFLAKGKPVQASRVSYDPDTGAVDFIDGRHRFAVLRDLGLHAVGVMVPRKQADTFRELFGAPPEPEAEPPGDLRDLLFPPPAEADVFAWLARFVRPQDYALIGTDSDRRMPETLAQQIAVDMSLGKSQREVAKAVLPHLDGSRVRAVRAARTFGLYTAHQGQQAAWNELGDLVSGYQVHAVHDVSTRPAHAARDGTTYHKTPQEGQKGLDEMPHPPLEADGSMAWNCRCYLTPNLSV